MFHFKLYIIIYYILYSIKILYIYMGILVSSEHFNGMQWEDRMGTYPSQNLTIW